MADEKRNRDNEVEKERRKWENKWDITEEGEKERMKQMNRKENNDNKWLWKRERTKERPR